MPKSTLLFIIFLAICATALGYNYFVRPFGQLTPVVAMPSPSPSSTPEPLPPVDAELAQKLQQLTPAQRVAQVMAAPLTISANAASLSATLSQLQQFQPGVVTLFGEKISTTSARSVITQLHQPVGANGILPWVAVDHEGGTVQRLAGAGFTKLPSWQSLCATEMSSMSATLTRSATELHEVGVDLVLAPVLDVHTAHPVLKTRVCSGDRQRVVDRAQQFAAIFQGSGIIPVFKHFPGIGQTTRDLHSTFDQVTVTPEDAAIYRQLLTIFPQVGVMTTHVGVTNQFATIPCSLSSACVKQLTTNFPQTLIVSDALEMVAAGSVPNEAPRTLSERAIQAVLAGNHLLLFGPTVSPAQLSEIQAALVAEYELNPTFQKQLDASAVRVLEFKRR